MIYAVTVEETVRRKCDLEIESSDDIDKGTYIIRAEIEDEWKHNELDDKMKKMCSNGEQWGFNKLENITIVPIGRVKMTKDVLNLCNEAFETDVDWPSGSDTEIDNDSRTFLDCIFKVYRTRNALRKHINVSQAEFNNMRKKRLIKHINNEYWVYFNKKIYEWPMAKKSH